MPASKTVPAVERALDILEALDVSRKGMGISEISRKLDIPRSTAHILMLTLEKYGYVTKNATDRNYILGTRVYHLGREIIRNQQLPQVALEPMKWLASKSRLTCHLSIMENGQAVYVQKVEGPGFIHFDTRIGKRTNLHCTSVGKVLLSFGLESQRKKFFSAQTFAHYTRNTITSAADLKVELGKVQAQGWALDDEEEELDVRCLAVPVFNPNGELLAALSVTGTVGQIPDGAIPNLAGLLQQASARIYNYVGTHPMTEEPEEDEA